jgi:Ca-activated chloride channel family protein
MRLSHMLMAGAMLAATTGTMARAETNLLFIMDGSNSMWGQIDQTAKMETAKTTLSKLVTDLPKDAKVGLMAYGHRKEGDCKDVELLSGLGETSAEALAGKIKTLQPTGKTPIAFALEQSKVAFAGKET